TISMWPDSFAPPVYGFNRLFQQNLILRADPLVFTYGAVLPATWLQNAGWKRWLVNDVIS
ncbi:MAG: hypothetical protein WCL16_07095, partial [bacterium]